MIIVLNIKDFLEVLLVLELNEFVIVDNNLLMLV